MKFRGLDSSEAKKLLAQYGPNQLEETSTFSPASILLRQIRKNFLLYLLFFAALISFAVGKSATAYTIFAVITVMIGTGFIQEFKAERAVGALKSMILPFSTVIRDGKAKKVSSSEIVPGDIIILRTGERIPADGLILDAKELRINEAVLTGESKEITKSSLADESGPSQENRVFMGTFVVNGKCAASITHTGMNTEYGKIARMISSVEKELPLQVKINRIAKYMATLAITVSVLTGFVMLRQAGDVDNTVIVEILMVVVALAVSAIPEGLPVVLTTTLASGASRMAKKNAIVNRMSIIETLGETTVVCSDKTGTITAGEMTVKKVFFDGEYYDVEGTGYNRRGEILRNGAGINKKTDAPLTRLFEAATLCNDAEIEQRNDDQEYEINGTPTESALLILAEKAGVLREDMEATRIDEIPFNSDRKKMSVVYASTEGHIVYSKGAPEILLQDCTRIQHGDSITELTKEERDKIYQTNNDLNSQGLRTIALAYKTSKSANINTLEKDLVFLGLAGMEDAPREGVKEAIAVCHQAGIRVMMITGDNLDTALAIAKEVGIDGKSIVGKEIDEITDEELVRTVNDYAIFARVRPDHKLRIVRALKANGEVVTMTGDGVNDAPALKEAHIGVAMGKNGTDVSREVADLTLKDDNFSTIVAAISEGRTIFSNIRKFVVYQLSCNFAELVVVFVGILLGLPLPLLALQILFMNLVTDDLPAISLGFNPHSHDVMTTKPRKRSQLLDAHLLVLLVAGGLFMAIGTLSVYYFVLVLLSQDVVIARTAAFVTLICFEIVNAFNFRSFRSTFSQLPFTANRYLVYASAGSIIATLAVIYTPINAAFEVTPLGYSYWLISIPSALLIVALFDGLKTINNRRKYFNWH
ncbi:MAG: Calcium-transporting ATPase 1 [bacterium ADurb.Bin400]|nr:MAG: Calcium-transporting ATPase 1 [bacterium ADurb.Bin400]